MHIQGCGQKTGPDSIKIRRLKESVDSVSGKKTLLYELEEIMILGKQNDEYFMVNLYGEKQRPGVEYLFEFGLREL